MYSFITGLVSINFLINHSIAFKIFENLNFYSFSKDSDNLEEESTRNLDQIQKLNFDTPKISDSHELE